MAPGSIDTSRERGCTRALALIRALIASFTSSARAIEASTGLTNAQLFLLRQAAHHDGVSINELAALARTRQNGVSAVAAKLVQAGLLTNTPSPVDRRRASLTVTPQGRRILKRAPESPTEALIAGLEALDPHQIRSLVTGLAALTAALQLHPETAPMLFERPARQRGPGVRASTTRSDGRAARWPTRIP